MKLTSPECPKCGSKQVMAKRDGTSWCRKCGAEWKRSQKVAVA